MKIFRRLAALILSLSLLLSPALAADLWASALPDRAAELGLLSGSEDGAAPWSRYLAALPRSLLPYLRAQALVLGLIGDRAAEPCAQAEAPEATAAAREEDPLLPPGAGVTETPQPVETATPEPEPVPEPEPEPEPVSVFTDPLLLSEGQNRAKSLLLFGDPDTLRFSDQETARAAMTQVTIPVWRIRNGAKAESSLTLTVHRALATEVVAIFTEIFQDPEQFPIYAVEGFRWVSGSTGEHTCGTAIDINARENYQVRNGQVLAGDHWTPGEDPCSIPEDGSVVRVFKSHGWSWGGDAWVEFRPDYHDYMHFSYMGR